MGSVIYRNPKNGKRVIIKKGFNVFVFIFGPLWFIFNGMPLMGIMWLCLAMVTGFFTLGLGALLTWIIASFTANGLKERKLIRKGWQVI